jgi:histidinol-phosphate/aromatic aminotransferase/cobyric acid decarboxylase-like protein
VVPLTSPQQDHIWCDPRALPIQTALAWVVLPVTYAVTDRTKIAYLCNPNNPTGTMITRAEVD